MTRRNKKPARTLERSSRQGGKNNGQAINPVYIVTQTSGFCKGRLFERVSV